MAARTLLCSREGEDSAMPLLELVGGGLNRRPSALTANHICTWAEHVIPETVHRQKKLLPFSPVKAWIHQISCRYFPSPTTIFQLISSIKSSPGGRERTSEPADRTAKLKITERTLTSPVFLHFQGSGNSNYLKSTAGVRRDL